ISKRDWSSDVCSSDLTASRQTLTRSAGWLCYTGKGKKKAIGKQKAYQTHFRPNTTGKSGLYGWGLVRFRQDGADNSACRRQQRQIGRASCRERVESAG